MQQFTEMLYHVTQTGLTVEGFRSSLARAIASAMANGSYTLAIAVQQQLDIRELLNEVLGEKYARRLFKGGSEVKFSGVSIHLVENSSEPAVNVGALVAVNTSPDYFGKLVSSGKAAELIFIAQTNADLELFLRDYSSQAL